MTPIIEAIAMAWDGLRERYAAYDAVLPGSPGFVCLVQECTAHCCRKFTVNLGEAEVARLVRYSGLEPVAFLESEDGKPIALPLAQPYILGRTGGHCTLLGDDLACTQYHARPEACRLYPHFVIAIRRSDGRPVYADVAGIHRAVAAAIRGEEDDELVPLLLRHRECPGFGGPPVSDESWRALLAETCRVQYPPGE